MVAWGAPPLDPAEQQNSHGGVQVWG